MTIAAPVTLPPASPDGVAGTAARHASDANPTAAARTPSARGLTDEVEWALLD